MKVNVCFLHKQDTGKWQWFLADQHGKALLKRIGEFDSIELAQADHEKNKEQYEARLNVSV